MYWILDKGYLVNLFSVANLQHWKWRFVFKTILAVYSTTKALIWHFRTKLDYFLRLSSPGTIHF